MRRLILVAFVAIFAVAGCRLGSIFDTGDDTIHLSEPMPLLEPFAVDTSEWIEGSVLEGTTVFDLSSLAFVADRNRRIDLHIIYITASTCDQELFVKNARSGVWDRVTPPRARIACGDAVTSHDRMFLRMGLEPRDYIDAEGRIRFAAPDAVPEKLRVYELNRRYNAVHIRVPYYPTNSVVKKTEFGWFSLLAVDEFLNVVPADASAIYRVNREGVRVDSIGTDPAWIIRAMDRSPDGYFAIERSRTRLDGAFRNRIAEYSSGGTLLRTATMPDGWYGDAKYGDGTLWIAGYDTGAAIYAADPVAAFATGALSFRDTIAAPSNDIGSLTWDGSRLIVTWYYYEVGEQLSLIDPVDGIIVTYTTPFDHESPIDWHDGQLYVLQYGPFVTRYSLP